MRSGLVERTVALDRVDGLLAALGPEAEERRSALPAPVPALLVHGVAGVGKTAVLLEAAARAESRRLAVRFTTTPPSESGWPYAGVERVLQSLSGERVDAQPPGPTVPPQAYAARLLHALASAARQAPVLVIVDDVHWLDEVSALCLSYVVRRLAYDPVAVLLGHRDEPGDGRRAGAGNQLTDPFGDVPRVRLDELSSESAISLARNVGASVAVARAVVDHCGGLPLAVTQVVAALPPDQRSGAEPLPEPMPASTPERIFKERLLSLGEAACIAGAIAAVCEGMAAAALTTVLEDLGVKSALVEVERAGLLSLAATGPSWEHPLARSAAMGAVPAATLRQIKGRAADALEAVGGPPDTVTWLRVAAAEGPSEALALQLEAVADRAEATYSHRAAAEAWEAAADIGTDASRHGLRLARAAGRRFAEGSTEASKALGARALAAGVNGADRSRLLFDLARLAEGTDPAHAVDLYERAAEAALGADDRRGAARALAAAVHPGRQMDDIHRVDLTVTRLVDVHDPADPYQVFLMHASRGFADFGAERPEGAIALEQAIAVCEQGSFVNENSDLVRTIIQVLYWVGQGSRLRGELLSALDERRRVGDLIGVGKTLYYLAWSDFYAGPAESAQLLATQALEVARDGGLSSQVVDALTTLSATESLRGNRQLAVALASEASAKAIATGSVAQLAEAAWAETFACLAAGDGAAAAAAADPLADLILSNRLGYYDHEYYTVAVALASNGDKARAQSVRDVIAAAGGESPGIQAKAALALADAVIGGGETAVEQLVLFTDDLVRSGWRLWAGRLLLAHGTILRSAGERTEARRSLRSAADVFAEIGALAWFERVHDELRASGVKVRSGWSEPLTGAELRVARAVADGLTNREVASLLFLSPKTVEFHLGRVYQKLGIRSRTQLAKQVHSGALSHDSGPDG